MPYFGKKKTQKHVSLHAIDRILDRDQHDAELQFAYLKIASDIEPQSQDDIEILRKCFWRTLGLMVKTSDKQRLSELTAVLTSLSQHILVPHKLNVSSGFKWPDVFVPEAKAGTVISQIGKYTLLKMGLILGGLMGVLATLAILYGAFEWGVLDMWMSVLRDGAQFLIAKINQ